MDLNLTDWPFLTANGAAVTDFMQACKQHPLRVLVVVVTCFKIWLFNIVTPPTLPKICDLNIKISKLGGETLLWLNMFQRWADFLNVCSKCPITANITLGVTECFSNAQPPQTRTSLFFGLWSVSILFWAYQAEIVSDFTYKVLIYIFLITHNHCEEDLNIGNQYGHTNF